MVYKMWRWPQNWQLKKHNQFWLKLIGFSFLGHLIVLGFAFFSHKKTNLKLTVFAKPRKNVEVIFMPMYKKIDQKPANLLPGKKQIAKKSEIKKPEIKKTEIKPVEKKPKPEVKKNTKKVEPKIKKKVIDQVKKKTPDKPKVIKPESKNIPKQPELKAEIKPESNLVLAPIINEPIYLGRQDLKEFQLMNELESVLVQNWQPPIGFGPQVECVVEIVVGSAGEIIDLVIKKSSNILAYDMSVRRNFNGMVLPKSASNKTLTVVFRP